MNPSSLPLPSALRRGVLCSLLAVLMIGVVAERSQAWTQPVQPVVHDAKLALGEEFSCAIDGNDTVQCWGRNDHYQTGSAAVGPKSAPVSVALSSAAVAVTAGIEHACAIVQDGGVWCWGNNALGQAGHDGVAAASPIPQLVPLIEPAISVSAGAGHTCAVLSTNEVRCWGDNTYGQLGDGSFVAATTTTVAVTGVSATRVSVGRNHSCVIAIDGLVRCWGWNITGQLGDGSTDTSSTAVTASVIRDVTQLDAGPYATCAVTGGRAWCWGANDSGELGNGTADGSTVPVMVSSLSGVTTLSIGQSVACFATQTQGLWCAGSNSLGELGKPNEPTAQTPISVPLMSGEVSTVQAGRSHVCGTSSDGNLFCWGENYYGQVGIGSLTHSYVPRDSWDTDAPSQIAVSRSGSCAVRNADVYCWGENEYGQLGDGTNTEQVDRFAAGSAMSDATDVATNGRFTCATHTDGTLWCWGLNYRGQLGDGTTTSRSTAAAVGGVSSVGSFSIGSDHACAVHAVAGNAQCWGQGANGRLGNGSTTSSYIAGSVVGVGGVGTLAGLSAISLGGNHSCALATSGAVYCWGYGTNGELGNGANSHSSTPVAVSSMTTATQITTGTDHTCALKADGTVWCWGQNMFGQLGDGSRSHSNVPSQMQLSADAAAVYAGEEVTCALLITGSIECAGYGAMGAMGNGTIEGGSVPVSVTSDAMVGYTVTELAVSSSHVCARATAMTVRVFCWGTNTKGVLGVSPQVVQEHPRAVLDYSVPQTTTTTTPTTTTTTTTTTPPATTPETLAPTTTVPVTTVPVTTVPVTTVPSTPTPKLIVKCSSTRSTISCTARKPSGVSGKVKYSLVCSLGASRKSKSVSSSSSRVSATVTQLRSKRTYSCSMKATKSSSVVASVAFFKKTR